MANEAILVQDLETKHFEATVADGTGLEKGTIMVFSADNNVVAASSADGEHFAGILLEEKVADDGQTKVALGRRGVYALKITAGGTSVLGEPVKVAGANQVTVADDDTIAHRAEVVGISLETGGNAEVVNVLIGGF